MNDSLANAIAITKKRICDNFRPEVASEVISGLDVAQVGVNVRVKFCDFRPNHSRDILLSHFVRTTTTTTTTTPAYAGHHVRGVLPKSHLVTAAAGVADSIIRNVSAKVSYKNG